MQKTGLKILLGGALLFPIMAYSLGLGDIDVKSFLNQPLNAEISIISARAGEIDDLLVGLANQDAFSRALLSRPSYLNNLKFKVIKSDDGTSAVIFVKTQSAVKEPVLNFLVEADWAKGKVFREFTILLDPPYYAQQIVKQATKNKVTQNQSVPSRNAVKAVKQAEPIVNQAPIQNKAVSTNNAYVNESSITEEYNYDISSLESESASFENQTRVNTDTDTQSQNFITIADGTTLWSVAKSLEADGISMSQVMLALQRINQDAFGQSNINNLKQGAVLRIPTQQDMADLSQRNAYVEVLNQNGLWNDYLATIGRASVNSSNTQTNNPQLSDSNGATDVSNNELSIVTEDDGSSDRAALRSDEAVEQVSTLRKQLLLSEEKIESLKIEKDELSDRVKMLLSELEKRNELDEAMSIEDDSLATMQQQLAQNEDANNKTLINEPALSQPNESMQDEIPDNVINDTITQAEPDNALTEEVIEPEIIDESANPETTIIVSEKNDSTGMFDNIIQALMSNPIVQGAIVGFFLLILLVVKFIKGRKNKEEDPEEESELIEDILSEDPIDTQSGVIIPNINEEDETPINAAESEESQAVDDFASTLSIVNSVNEEEDDEFSKTAIISAEDMPDVEPESDDEQDETLDEVDVYLAYSLFDNAEELLKEKLIESPDRADYRAKLLDTYYATKNKDAFLDEASSLKSLGSEGNKYWSRVQTMGYELDPSNVMFADGEGGDISHLAIAKPEMADFDVSAENDESDISEFDLSLDGDDTNFDLTEDSSKINNENLGADGLPDDLGSLDFNLDGPDETTEDNINEEIDISDSLDFDLEDSLEDSAKENDVDEIDISDSLDFDLEDSLEESAKENDIEEIDISDSLDFDLEESIKGNDVDKIDIADSLEFDLEESLEEPAKENDVTEIDISDSLDFDDSDTVKTLDIEDELDISLDDIDPELDVALDLNISDDASETVTMLKVESADDLGIVLSEDDVDSFEKTAIVGLNSSDDLSIDILDDKDNLEESDSAEKTEIISALDDELVIPDIDLDLDDLGLDDLDEGDITDIGDIEGLMLPDDVDEVATKLDLAKAFQDMGDSEGARGSLEEVVLEGTDEQKAEAQALLDEIAD